MTITPQSIKLTQKIFALLDELRAENKIDRYYMGTVNEVKINSTETTEYHYCGEAIYLSITKQTNPNHPKRVEAPDLIQMYYMVLGIVQAIDNNPDIFFLEKFED